jgi:hypothetical protein
MDLIVYYLIYFSAFMWDPFSMGGVLLIGFFSKKNSVAFFGGIIWGVIAQVPSYLVSVQILGERSANNELIEGIPLAFGVGILTLLINWVKIKVTGPGSKSFEEEITQPEQSHAVQLDEKFVEPESLLLPISDSTNDYSRNLKKEEAAMGFKFWMASGIMGVSSAFFLEIVKYKSYSGGSFRLETNGALATLGLVFLSSIALKFIRDAITEKPQELEETTQPEQSQNSYKLP